MNGFSQVTIKEEKPEHLDMWAFKDVVVGEVNKNTAALEVKENCFSSGQNNEVRGVARGCSSCRGSVELCSKLREIFTSANMY